MYAASLRGRAESLASLAGHVRTAIAVVVAARRMTGTAVSHDTDGALEEGDFKANRVNQGHRQRKTACSSNKLHTVTLSNRTAPVVIE